MDRYIPERASITCRSSRKPTKQELEDRELLQILSSYSIPKSEKQKERDREAEAFLFLYSN